MRTSIYIYIYFACLSVSLFVSYETAKPTEPKFCTRPHMTTGKVYGWSNFKNKPPTKFDFYSILKIHEIFFYKLRATFYLLCYKVYKEKMFTIEIEDGLGAPWNRRWAWSTLKAQLLIKHFIQVLVLIISLRIKTSDIVFLI